MAAVQLAVSMGEDPQRYSVRSKDLSLGGACIYADSALPVGAQLTLHVPWPASVSEASGQVEAILARVVWVTSIDDEFQMGLGFSPLGGAARRCVEAVCAELRDAANDAVPSAPKRSFDLS